MKTPVLAVAALFALPAFAQLECPKPAPRPLIALQSAISQDESMAQAFDLAAAGCVHSDMTCDEARAKCGGSLTATLQKQLNFDEGAYLRDMLIAYQGQQYRMATPIPSAAPLNDVSCNADAEILKAAGARRRVQAERRKLMLAEYPRWTIWVNQQYQLCADKAAADKIRSDAAAADAAKLLAAAELAKKAEELKIDQGKAAEKAIKDKADADAKAAKDKLAAEQKVKDDALAAQKAAQAEAKKQQDAAAAAAAEKAEAEKRAAADRLEAEKRAKESAEETAARQRKEAEEARLVADREGKKEAAKQKQAELIAKEKAREDEVNLRHETARRNAEAAHQKKLEELKHRIELTEADKAAQAAEEDKAYEESEIQRREAAKKEIELAGKADHSDERMTGALAGHATGGYISIGSSSAPLIGGRVSISQGFWATAPAQGMASGAELRATGLFLTSPDTKAMLIQVAAEFRYWFGRFGLGLAGEYQNLKSTYGTVTSNPFTIPLGVTLSLAAVDDHDARVFFTVRYLPFVVAGSPTAGGASQLQFERVTGEIEGGYAIFSFAVQGGVVKDNSVSPSQLGFFVGGSLGARLRW